jgi:hypothetical protein
MNATAALIALGVGFGGVVLGAMLTRRNDRRSHGDVLLADAANDAVRAVAAVASSNSTDAHAQTAYASAVSRLALHGTPPVVAAWRSFQNDATTETTDGRVRMVAAIQATRAQLGTAMLSTPIFMCFCSDLADFGRSGSVERKRRCSPVAESIPRAVRRLRDFVLRPVSFRPKQLDRAHR